MVTKLFLGKDRSGYPCATFSSSPVEWQAPRADNAVDDSSESEVRFDTRRRPGKIGRSSSHGMADAAPMMVRVKDIRLAK